MKWIIPLIALGIILIGSSIAQISLEPPATKENITWNDDCSVRCVGDNCKQILGQTFNVKDSDEKCKAREDAQSLKNSPFYLNISYDGVHKVECHDFNWTHRDCTFSLSENATDKLSKDIPITVLKTNETYKMEQLEKQQPIDEDKLYVTVSEQNVNFETKEDSLRTVLAVAHNEIIKYGSGSTTIKLDDTTIEILADLFAQDAAPTSDDNEDQIRWNISSIPVSATISDATMCLWIADCLIDCPDNDVTFWRVDDQSWDETISTGDFDSQTTDTETTGKTWNSTADDSWACLNVTTALIADYDDGNDDFTIRYFDPDNPHDGGSTAVNDEHAFGLGFGGQTDAGFFKMEDREDTMGTGNTPYLDITYTEADLAPTWSTNTTNSTLAGTPIEHRISWADAVNLSGYVFGLCNGTWNGTNCLLSEWCDGTAGACAGWDNETACNWDGGCSWSEDVGNEYFVQYGEATFGSSTTDTATITAVDQSRAFIIGYMTGDSGAGDAAEHLINFRFTADTTITATRGETGDTPIWTYFVVEAKNEQFEVQMPSVMNMAATVYTDTEDIGTNVQTEYAMVVGYCTAGSSGTGDVQDGNARFAMSDNDTVLATRGTAADGVSASCYAQVIEWNPDYVGGVQSGVITLAGTLPTTDTITAVNLSSSFLYYNWDSESNGLQQTFPECWLSDSTTVSCTRWSSTAYTNDIQYYVVTNITDTNVTHGRWTDAPDTSDTYSVTVHEVNRSLTAVFSGGSTMGTGTAMPRNRWSCIMNSDTTIDYDIYYGDTTYGQREESFSMVQFPNTQAEGGNCSGTPDPCSTYDASQVNCERVTCDWNSHGDWVNDTWTAMIGTDNWSNVTKTVNSTVGVTIGWKAFANDSSDNWNTTHNFQYVTTTAVGDSCDYSSGDFEIDCSENCVIDSATDVGGNDVIFSNSGEVLANVTVENIGMTLLSSGCTITLGSGIIWTL